MASIGDCVLNERAVELSRFESDCLRTDEARVVDLDGNEDGICAELVFKFCFAIETPSDTLLDTLLGSIDEFLSVTILCDFLTFCWFLVVGDTRADPCLLESVEVDVVEMLPLLSSFACNFNVDASLRLVSFDPGE